MPRVRYSFSSRRTRQTKNISKQREKFPRILLKVVDHSDIILQILDARFVEDTRNLEVEELVKRRGKAMIYVLNKIDLTTKEKVRKINNLKKLVPYVFISASKRQGGKELRNKIKILAKRFRDTRKQEIDKVYVGIIGYPNTGKSSIINLLIGKSSAKTGASAGFTKGIQKLKLSKDIMLLDSPGVIPDKEYSSVEMKSIAKHAKVGARTYDRLRDPEMVITKLFREYPKVFQKYYKTKTTNPERLIETIGKKRNLFKKHGVVDTDKASRMILKDWQSGNIKNI